MSETTERIAVVTGLRTPFQKIGGAYLASSPRQLGGWVVKEMVERSNISPELIDQLVYGQVVSSPEAPNIAREVVIGGGLPVSVDAYSVSRACATAYQACVNVIQNIRAGQCRIGIAGGADNISDAPLTIGKTLSRSLVTASKSRSFGGKLAAFKGARFVDLMPKAPAIKEPSSNYTMGEAAEKMAKENGIPRDEQDAFAHRSHKNAANAWQQGWFDNQVIDVFPAPKFKAVSKDNLFRSDSELDKYQHLKPVFDRRHGSVTAGNSSPLTDGASAVLLMPESVAKALGYSPLGYICSYAFHAIDPDWQMLMGPAFAIPKALEYAGMKLSDIDLIDMHEAFAAQVLSNVQALESREFAKTHLNRISAVGKIDMDRLNITGSSISLGHPFAATGTRQLTQLLHDLHRTNKTTGLISACAAGGLGAAMIVEVA
ncbi:MAG: acetyl-CoA C-acyltransferase FadI [Proteobacteria bacterium]|jgi:acetyl-CoA acyltransferase|nr:acetyl-CoA C-acyltransferase FadI [Pseudomonadota bacterium]